MKLHTLAAAAVLSAAVSVPALAAEKVSATLQTPVAAKTKVVAAGAVFTCEGSACVAAAAPARALSAAGCKALVKEVGRVSAFGAERKALDAADLERCNAAAG